MLPSLISPLLFGPGDVCPEKPSLLLHYAVEVWGLQGPLQLLSIDHQQLNLGTSVVVSRPLNVKLAIIIYFFFIYFLLLYSHDLWPKITKVGGGVSVYVF